MFANKMPWIGHIQLQNVCEQNIMDRTCSNTKHLRTEYPWTGVRMGIVCNI